MRILGISLIAYLVSFILGVAASIALGLNNTIGQTPMIMWIALLVISLLVTLFATMRYFQDTDIIPSITTGMGVGFFITLVSKVIDLVIFVTAALGASTMVNIGGYYSHPMFWLTIMANIAMGGFVAYALEKDL